jgi:hypothetical protein
MTAKLNLSPDYCASASHCVTTSSDTGLRHAENFFLLILMMTERVLRVSRNPEKHHDPRHTIELLRANPCRDSNLLRVF